MISVHDGEDLDPGSSSRVKQCHDLRVNLRETEFMLSAANQPTNPLLYIAHFIPHSYKCLCVYVCAGRAAGLSHSPYKLSVVQPQTPSLIKLKIKLCSLSVLRLEGKQR